MTRFYLPPARRRRPAVISTGRTIETLRDKVSRPQRGQITSAASAAQNIRPLRPGSLRCYLPVDKAASWPRPLARRDPTICAGSEDTHAGSGTAWWVPFIVSLVPVYEAHGQAITHYSSSAGRSAMHSLISRMNISASSAWSDGRLSAIHFPTRTIASMVSSLVTISPPRIAASLSP